MLTTRELIEDPALMGCHPSYAGGLASWQRWLWVHDFLDRVPKARLSAEQLAFFNEAAGGRAYEPEQWSTFLIIAPRREGKSELMKAQAAHAAVMPGPRGTYAALLAQDVKASVRALLTGLRDYFRPPSKLHEALISETTDELRLADCTASVWPASRPQSLRGIACRFVGIDEGDWLSSENGADVLRQLVAAAKPTLATVPGSKLVIISSPGKYGSTLHEMHRAAFGQNDPHVLALKLRDMNCNLTAEYKASMRALDPIAARREIEWDPLESTCRHASLSIL